MSETMGYTDAILDGMDEIAKHTRDGGKVVRGLIAEVRKLQRERDEARKTLTNFREWPCEQNDCEHTLGDLEDSEADAPHPSGGCWFCLRCWNKGITTARDEARKTALEEAADLAKASNFVDGHLGTIEGQIARAIRALAGSKTE